MPQPSFLHPTLNLCCWLGESLSSQWEEEKDLSFGGLCVLVGENCISLAQGQPGETKANSPTVYKVPEETVYHLCCAERADKMT